MTAGGLELWGHLAAIFALGEVEEGGAPVVVWGECTGGCVCMHCEWCVGKIHIEGYVIHCMNCAL